MTSRVYAKVAPLLLLLAPVLAILAARMATHSDLAARYPRSSALLFLWIAADALALSAIAKAPDNRPGLRAMLGAIAAGCVVATLAAAAPVRDALLDMRGVVAAMGLTVIAYCCWSLLLASRTYRRTRSLSAAAMDIFPEPLVRFAAIEGGMIRLALFRWGREPDVPAGAHGHAYHRVINPMIAVFLVLQLIEIVVVHLLVSHWSRIAALVLLALGIWGALFFIALMKGFRLYPVLTDETGVRVRGGSMVDLYVPYAEIAGIEAAISDRETRQDDVLNAAILSHPNIVLRLSRPTGYVTLFGKRRMVTRVAFRLDEPAPFLAELQKHI